MPSMAFHFRHCRLANVSCWALSWDLRESSAAVLLTRLSSALSTVKAQVFVCMSNVIKGETHWWGYLPASCFTFPYNFSADENGKAMWPVSPLSFRWHWLQKVEPVQLNQLKLYSYDVIMLWQLSLLWSEIRRGILLTPSQHCQWHSQAVLFFCESYSFELV